MIGGSISRNTSFLLGNLFTVSQKQFSVDWRIETFVEIFDALMIYLYPDLSERPRPNKRKRPLKFIITGCAR